MSNRGGCAILFNLLTVLIGFLVLAALALVVAAFAAPDLVPQLLTVVGIEREERVEIGPTPTSVARAIVPTAPNSLAPEGSEVINPTWTPSGAEVRDATATPTLRPTDLPSVTPTFPPPTPTRTPTPTPTNTPTPGPSPTATNTRSAYAFTRDIASPQFVQNFANNAGCNWSGVGGNVFALDGSAVPNGAYRVHVWGGGIDERADVGGASAGYGPGGWEQFLFNAPTVRDYNVQLETVNGTAVSEAYSVQSRASCSSNLILFDFVQNH